MRKCNDCFFKICSSDANYCIIKSNFLRHEECNVTKQEVEEWQLKIISQQETKFQEIQNLLQEIEN